MVFLEGIHVNDIGGDAGSMPVEDSFATKMALHFSLEHFEQDPDIRFIKEAIRVLRKGGKWCILPLYLFNRYAIKTDPSVLPRGDISFKNKSYRAQFNMKYCNNCPLRENCPVVKHERDTSLLYHG